MVKFNPHLASRAETLHTGYCWPGKLWQELWFFALLFQMREQRVVDCRLSIKKKYSKAKAERSCNFPVLLFYR